MKPLILRLERDFVCPLCQEIQNQRPHPFASLEATPPVWQTIHIDQAEWSHATDSLRHAFSVTSDEGCHLEYGQEVFPMRDTHQHRNLVWTELRDFYLERCGKTLIVAETHLTWEDTSSGTSHRARAKLTTLVSTSSAAMIVPSRFTRANQLWHRLR